MGRPPRAPRRHGPEIVGLAIDDDRLVGLGFLGIRRLSLRTVRADGSRSEPFNCDFMVRPVGLDAVVVAIWARVDGRIEVLLREGLRPGLRLGRTAATLPVAEPERPLYLTEVVAGIVEAGDHGEAGLRQRAALEVAEEAGFTVRAEDVELLGAGTFSSPGALPEKCWLCAVEVEPDAQAEPEGDGSAMEEGARTWWRGLDDAIAACVAGELEDAKTEIVLRRLRDRLRDRGLAS